METRISMFLLCAYLLCPPCASPEIAIVGNLTHERSVSPGEVYRGEIMIRNNSTESEDVRIYPSDYRFSCDGTSQYDEPGSHVRSNSDWIDYSPSRVTMQPGEETIVQYSVRVPRDTVLVGTYWSILMVERVPPISPDSFLEDRKVGITTILRYGIQMITNIEETGLRRIQFLSAQVDQRDERREMCVDIENTGERMLRPSLWMELFDDDGRNRGRLEGGQFRIFPNTSVRYRLDLNDLAPGRYKVLVVADCGDEDLFGMQSELRLIE